MRISDWSSDVCSSDLKALVSEKFFDLCATFGQERVGMMTGDATVNGGAPIICCTAEILANIALRDGDSADVGQVVMDEIGKEACRERVCKYVEISVVAVSLKTNNNINNIRTTDVC